MRRLGAVLLALLVALPAEARQTHAPELLVIVCNEANSAHLGDVLAGFVNPTLVAYGARLTIVQANETGAAGADVPQLRSCQTYSRHAFMDDEWGRSRPFDGTIILGHDWGFASDGVRAESLTFAAAYGYADVPVLAVGNRNGFDKNAFAPDSTGAEPESFNVTRNSTAASVVGTPYQYGAPSGLAGETVTVVKAGYPGVTKLIEAVSGTDTTLVWRRNFGNGRGSLTCVNTATTGSNCAQGNDFYAILAGVASFMSQLPDSVRPQPVFNFALHVDDGMKRNDATAGGGIQPDQYARMAQAVDSLEARAIKYTLGMECSTDTMNALDANGLTRFANEMAAWDSRFAKYTPHVHAGVDAIASSRAGAQDLAGHFNDLYGSSRNRNCDPNASADTTLYWNAKAGLDTLRARVGTDKLDRCLMPPTDDYSPLNVNTSTCNLADMLSSYRRAGYISMRINEQPATNLPGGAAGGDPSGYYSTPGTYPTAFGDINLIACNNQGYLPSLSATSQTAETTTQRAQWLAWTFSGYFVGRVGFNQTNNVLAHSNIIVNHIRNYGGAMPGWQVDRDVDSAMRGLNAIAGYAQWQWAWSEQLSPRFPDEP